MCRHAPFRLADDNGQQVPGDVSAIPQLDMRFVYIIVVVVFFSIILKNCLKTIFSEHY